MKIIYSAAWVLLALSAFVMVLTGYFNPLLMVILSLITLGLVFAFALWVVLINNRDQNA